MKSVTRLAANVGLGALVYAMTMNAIAQDTPLTRAAIALGVDNVKSLRYTADGTGYSFGQAYKPGLAWPKIHIDSLTRTIDYESGSMRDEVAFWRAEGLGGGGYPMSGVTRNDQYLSGNFAWNQLATAPLPGPRFLSDRTHQLWITPHGVLRAAMRNKAVVQSAANGGNAFVFTEPNRFSAKVFVNSKGLVERVESKAPDAVLGDTTIVTTYSDYRDFNGVMFPERIRQTQGGFPVLDLTVRQVERNVPVSIQVPELVRTASERVAVDKVADGVWMMGGGSHNSVLIEMKDHLVLVEAPLTEGRTGAVIAEARKVVPNKPLRYVINSHPHFDHSGGLRTAAGEGLTIVTQAQNKAYFERAFGNPNSIAPDRLAKSGKRAQFHVVGEKGKLTDGSRTIELYRAQDSHHSDSFLIVYLPKEKLLIEADLFTPAAPNSPPPARPNPHHTNLIENLERLNLKPERIVPLHGRVVPVADLYTAAGAKMQ
ncbi:MAG TPA: MBL fold metallo-hydrolase [Casimicrobiaceae bacterium]|nr:MBL fold metallo-hydrolase [Casimicrobiaceae bacterium]